MKISTSNVETTSFVNVKKPYGYWTEENIINELKLVIKELSHFPTGNELVIMKRTDLKSVIDRNGGFNKFRKLLNCEIIQNSKGYWTEEIIILELESVINELDHFPLQTELIKMNKSGLMSAITQHGGFNNFRTKMGYQIFRKSNNFWNEKTTITELKIIIEETNHFPLYDELIEMNRLDLLGAINKYGGFIYFRRKMGYKLIRRPNGYWTKEIIITELESVISNIGYFPTQNQLSKMKRCDLQDAITQCGGANYFRRKMGYKILKKSNGYWSEKTMIEELKQVIEELDHFPSYNELNIMNKKDLESMINKSGGLIHFRERMGYNISLHEKYKSELSSYINKRGRASEDLIKEIITEWSNIHNKPSPDFNVKLAPGNIIEFVCDFDKKVGIDVTNTKASRNSTFNTIKRKWRHKDYCLYLNELWVVIFTDVLLPEDYDKLNMKSPNNVKVFSTYEFLKELDYSTEYCDMNKIDNLKNCSFHNKEEIMGINKNKGEEVCQHKLSIV